jgi:hypothetical protein
MPISNAEACARYKASEKGRAARDAYSRSDRCRELKRLSAAKLRATPEGKEAIRLAKAKYRATEKYRKTLSSYLHTPDYKRAHAVSKAKYLSENKERINRDRLPLARAYGTSARGKEVRARYMSTPSAKRLHAHTYLRRTYGISLAEFEAMSESQGGVCAICGKPNRAGRRLVVDHDHATGKVRALLCDPCNLILGYAEDSEEMLQAAIAYVAKFKCRRITL